MHFFCKIQINQDLFCNFAPEMKKLYIETYGCQMNVADSEVVASVMQMAGYENREVGRGRCRLPEHLLC